MKHLLQHYTHSSDFTPESGISSSGRKQRFSRAFAWLSIALAGLFFLPDSSYGRVYNNRELKKAGFYGRYRGTARGTVTEWNGTLYIPRSVSGTVTQKVPARTRRITGPDGNQFSLFFRQARGSSRRVVIRGAYSGVSWNPFWGFNMVARGTYVVTLVKRGRGRSERIKATVVDRFSERAQVGGSLYNYWALSARNLQ